MCIQHVRVVGPRELKRNQLRWVRRVDAKRSVLVEEAIQGAASRAPVQPQDHWSSRRIVVRLDKPVVKVLGCRRIDIS